MEIELLNSGLLSALHEKAEDNVRLRQKYDFGQPLEMAFYNYYSYYYHYYYY